MVEHQQNDVLAEVGISSARKLLLVLALFGLGVVLVGIAFRGEATFLARAVLFFVGSLSMYQGDKIRRTPDLSLQLSKDGLFQSDGVLVASAEHFKSIDRGALAMKPSNGFVLVLSEKQPRAWAPGLWWRLGKRVGVGGVANAGAARFMAEQIAMTLKAKSG